MIHNGDSSMEEAGKNLTFSMTIPNQPVIPSVPTNSAYAGKYGFEVSFQKQKKETKSASWTYSEELRKLYVRMRSSCPIRFKTMTSPPRGCVVRALPLYIKPEHVQEVVRRCPNHSSPSQHRAVYPPENHTSPSQHRSVYQPDSYNHDAYVDSEAYDRYNISSMPTSSLHNYNDANKHLLICENKQVEYTEDPYTGRLSVTFPHESPQAGTDWVTNLFQFACFSSCVGGLNRRPLQIIFTLEHGSQVLGRQAVEVRVCACPARDRKSEEKSGLKMLNEKVFEKEREFEDKTATQFNERPEKKKAKMMFCNQEEKVPCHEVFNHKSETYKNVNLENNNLYTLKVVGRENYVMLRKMRDSLELYDVVPQHQKEFLHRTGDYNKSQHSRQTSSSFLMNITYSNQEKVSSISEESHLENEVSSTEKNCQSEVDHSTILQLLSPSSFSSSSSTNLDASSSSIPSSLVITSSQFLLPSANQSTTTPQSSFYQIMSPSIDLNNVLKFKKADQQQEDEQHHSPQQHSLAPISDFHQTPPPFLMPASTSATYFKIFNNTVSHTLNNTNNNLSNGYENYELKQQGQQEPLQHLILNVSNSTQPIYFETDTTEEHNYCEIIANNAS